MILARQFGWSLESLLLINIPGQLAQNSQQLPEIARYIEIALELFHPITTSVDGAGLITTQRWYRLILWLSGTPISAPFFPSLVTGLWAIALLHGSIPVVIVFLIPPARNIDPLTVFALNLPGACLC